MVLIRKYSIAAGRVERQNQNRPFRHAYSASRKLCFSVTFGVTGCANAPVRSSHGFLDKSCAYSSREPNDGHLSFIISFKDLSPWPAQVATHSIRIG